VKRSTQRTLSVKRSTAHSIILIAAITAAVVIGLAFRTLRQDNPAAGASAPARRPPQRVICMAPNITETVFALGAGGRVVGVTTYSDLGSLYDPNLEKIVALKPDLLIVQQKHAKVEALCRERGIRVLKVQMTRLDSIQEGILAIGRALDVERRAEELSARIRRELAAAAANIDGKNPPRVFLCVDRTPGTLKGAFTVGAESFLTELVELAGGENIFRDVRKDYFQVSTEALVARAPDIIIEMRAGRALSAEARADIIADWAALGDVPAVRSKRIYILTENYLVVPGPRVAKIARLLASRIHGGAKNDG